MFQKLLEPFKTKGAKINGDLQVQVQQNPIYAYNSHLNSLTLSVKGDALFQWYRINNNNNEQKIDNLTQTYIFSLQDVQHIIKCIITQGSRKAIITIGPIIIDKTTQMSLQNILQHQGWKFPITIQNILIKQGDYVVAQINQANLISTLSIEQEEIKFIIESKNVFCSIKYSIEQPMIILENNDIHFQFRDLDFSNFEQMKQMIKSILGHQLNKEDNIDICFTASSTKQINLIVLLKKFYGAKQILLTQKVQQQIDKIFIGLFEECTFNSPVDLLMIIANQQEQISGQNQMIQYLSKEKNQLVNKLITMEQEIEQTIQTYQELLQEHNITAANLNQSILQTSSLNRSLGKSNVWQKQIEIKQNEINDLKYQVQKLSQVPFLQKSEINYNLVSRDTLIKQLKELEGNWQNAKRLNEILNKQLIANKNEFKDQNQIQELQQRITELEYQNQLVTDYHDQLVSKQKQIDALNAQIKYNQSDDYIRQLEDEVDYLRNMTENQTDVMTNSQITQIQVNQQLNIDTLQQENERLREEVQNLKRKHKSLIKEIESLNPYKAQEFQYHQQLQAANKQIRLLQQQLIISQQQQEQQELQRNQNMEKSTNSRYSQQRINTECSKDSISPSLQRGVSKSEHRTGIFDQMMPKPMPKKMQLIPTNQHQKAYSMLQFE